MTSEVYLITIKGGDTEWLLVREETWMRAHGAPLDSLTINDVKAYFHEDDFEETMEALLDQGLMIKDLGGYLPPIAVDGESASFTDVTSLSHFLRSKNLTVVDEMTIHT